MKSGITIQNMARGWESKSVGEQIAGQEADATSPSEEQRVAVAAAADKQRKRQALELQRERILNARTANPHRRAALQAALSAIEEELRRIS